MGTRDRVASTVCLGGRPGHLRASGTDGVSGEVVVSGFGDSRRGHTSVYSIMTILGTRPNLVSLVYTMPVSPGSESRRDPRNDLIFTYGSKDVTLGVRHSTRTFFLRGHRNVDFSDVPISSVVLDQVLWVGHHRSDSDRV